MTTKITVIYDNPEDPAAFEAGYPDQLALEEDPRHPEGGELEDLAQGGRQPYVGVPPKYIYFTDYDATTGR